MGIRQINQHSLKVVCAAALDKVESFALQILKTTLSALCRH